MSIACSPKSRAYITEEAPTVLALTLALSVMEIVILTAIVKATLDAIKGILDKDSSLTARVTLMEHTTTAMTHTTKRARTRFHTLKRF